MVIKIKKEGDSKDRFRYKGSRKIITPHDIKKADKFDDRLSKVIKDIEKILLREKVILRSDKKKTDPLKAWYLIGSSINKFLEKNNVLKSEENLFWAYLYGRSTLLNKTMPKNKVSSARNDFKTAALLARYPFKTVENVGSWSVWRELLGYKAFSNDKRILDLVIDKLIEFPKKRNEARAFFKTLSDNFRNLDTTVLKDEELKVRFNKVFQSLTDDF